MLAGMDRGELLAGMRERFHGHGFESVVGGDVLEYLGGGQR
jgi:hypothetical protein